VLLDSAVLGVVENKRESKALARVRLLKNDDTLLEIIFAVFWGGT
jgi:hypothetical protein